MRVATMRTTSGSRLAVAKPDGWAVVDAPGAPTSVDQLVHGGDESRKQVEQVVAQAERIAQPALEGLCIPWPTKIIGVGLNYGRHAAEGGRPLPSTPMLFSKFHNSLVGSGQPVQLPFNAEQYDYEAELGVIIGRRAYRVAERYALDCVWGYCNCNDLSARDLQRRTTQVLLGKTLDGFLPVGPELVSADEIGDPQNLNIRAWLNGGIRQDANTSDMIFSVAELISYISDYIPLNTGDLIITGTPEGTIIGRDPQVWMTAGDVVEVEVAGLGRLVTPLIAGA
jgi:2-keto-4-pentenoate hydratase/2-oxohepta-3-ene-1,7-dioic acid hydratase in catechol pathway